MDKFLLILGSFFAALIWLCVTGAQATKQQHQKFMKQCQEDHKEY